jgi:signal transduction histidine kinase
LAGGYAALPGPLFLTMPIDLQLSDRRFNRLALLGIASGFALLLAALVAVITSFGAYQQASQLVRHTSDVVDALSVLDVQLERAESGRRAYLLAPNVYRLQVYRDNVQLAPRTVDLIATLTSDNPAQVENVARLRKEVQLQLADLKRSMDLVRGGRTVLAQAEFAAASPNSIIRDIRSITAEMRASELSLLADRAARSQQTLTTMRLLLVATGLMLLLVGAGSFWLVRRYTVDLTRTRDRLNVLNADLEGAVQERTMELRRANEEIQRFAYIVSHDLRSPLVNVMGFTAELEQTNKTLADIMDRAEEEAPHIVTDAMREARADLPEAIGFIRSSTQKMDRLINAILRLSREGRRILTPEPLAMDQVVTEIAATMEHRTADAGAAITVETPLPNLVGDRLAIEQIFSNLLDNAVKYLDPQRPGRIAVRGHAERGRIIYEVEDNGRGIDARDHERVFDLFRRSGTQNQPGEGIGLAHVRALVHRLGATIDLDSTLGQGTTFRLSFPETFADQGVAE